MYRLLLSKAYRGQIVLLVIMVTLFCAACKFNVAVLYSSKDLDTMEDKVFVKKMRHKMMSDSIVITYKNGTRTGISCDSVWGLGYADGSVYRYYKDQYYLLKQNASLKIYTQTHGGKSTHTCFYFSKTLDGEIYSLRWKNIQKQFQKDTCFLTALETKLKWYEDYSSFDKKLKTYKVISLYNDCKNK